MPTALRFSANAFLEKPGLRESGFARTSITILVPEVVSRPTNPAMVSPSYPHVSISTAISWFPNSLSRILSFLVERPEYSITPLEVDMKHWTASVSQSRALGARRAAAFGLSGAR